MTKWITSALLVASALVPAIASAQQPQDDRGEHADHRGPDRRAPDQRGARPAGQDHRGAQGAPHAQVQAGVNVQAQGGRGGYRQGGQPGYAGRGDQGRPNLAPNAQGGQGGYTGRGTPQGYAGDQHRGYPQGYASDPRRGPGGYAGRDDGRGGWNRGWRGDGRYNWGGYRNQNRGAFHLPRYYAPANWHNGYRRFSIGATLGYGLFGGNYWIADPYAYRLPPAYGPYRWVRYYNDALLVDTRSGYVVDTVYDIFW